MEIYKKMKGCVFSEHSAHQHRAHSVM